MPTQYNELLPSMIAKTFRAECKEEWVDDAAMMKSHIVPSGFRLGTLDETEEENYDEVRFF